MIKNSKQKFKYLEKEEKCFGEIKSILYHFKKALSGQKSSQVFSLIGIHSMQGLTATIMHGST